MDFVGGLGRASSLLDEAHSEVAPLADYLRVVYP